VLLGLSDVTALRRAEAALLKESERKDDFIASLSHELRNPLGPIRTNLAVLDRSPQDSPRARGAREAIERQMGRLTHLIDDLLDVSRIARGKVRLSRRVLDLGALVQQVVDEHRESFDAANLAMAFSPSPEPLWVDADATRIAQVLGNLLSNAAKFTAAGGRVIVSVSTEGNEARVCVADTGVGMAQDVLKRVFEPFTQEPQSLDRALGGLGLGLATVKGLVELHGGRVAVYSAGAMKGSQLVFTLPLTAAPPELRTAPPPPAQEAHRRVLVVDDNIDSATAIKELMECDGHEAEAAFDGPSAIERAQAFHPDIVICDIGLPGMDGYAVARAIRADERLRGSFLVALSGYARPDDQKRAYDAGFNRHVAKPARPGELEELVQAAAPAS